MRNFVRGILSLVGSCLLSSPAWADRYHHHTDIHWGIQIGTPWVYPPPYYPPYWPHVYVPSPPVIITAPPPTVYVERSPTATTGGVPSLEPGYWYYCRESGAYYPYVKQCAGDWHRVAPGAGQ